MATRRPVTVVMSAALDAGAMAVRLAEPAVATPERNPSRPSTAKQSEKRCAANRGGEEDHLALESQAFSPTARSIAVCTTRICEEEIFGAVSRRARKVRPLSALPRSWYKARGIRRDTRNRSSAIEAARAPRKGGAAGDRREEVEEAIAGIAGATDDAESS
jgi:hypothetical protein